ncbi:hypothetical protein Tco_0431985 [Tanacetum coccineum]
MANLTDMLSKFVTANTASTSGSGTLPGNTVTNPKEDLKDQTSRYTANFNNMTANRIDVIDMASEEYSQEVLGFSDSVAYGNPSTCFGTIVVINLSNLNSIWRKCILCSRKANAFLALDDDTFHRKVDPTYYDPTGHSHPRSIS